jgi:hypothetical protein
LIERWNGSRWSARTALNPSGGSQVKLDAVSCTAAGACTAVGSYQNDVGPVNLAGRLSGSRWRIEPTPNADDGDIALTYSGVACTSAVSCVAVGSAETEVGGGGESVAPVVDHWNGSSWSIQDAASPPGQSQCGGCAALNAIACTSRKACTAVGSYDVGVDDSTMLTWAERWNGSRWALQTTPNPLGGAGDRLAGVSCVFGDGMHRGRVLYHQRRCVGGPGGSLGWEPVGPAEHPRAGRRQEQPAQRRVVHDPDNPHRRRIIR